MLTDSHLTDAEAEELLRLMHKAVTEYGYEDTSLSEFVADVAMTMNTTTDKADAYRQEIELTLG